MKRYPLGRRMLAIGSLAGVPPLLVVLLALLLPAQYGESYLAAMQDKLSYLRNASGQRIVFIGGSSVPFALRSDLMEASIDGFTVVDFGLYADLGTGVMLDWARSAIRAGDLVVLMPEQDAQTLSRHTGGESILQACDGACGMLLHLRGDRIAHAAAAMPAFAAKKLRYTLTGSPQPEGVYQRRAMNSHGDIASPERARSILPGGREAEHDIVFDPNMVTDDMIAMLNRFAGEMRQRGAEVVYHFPPMNAAAVAPDEAARMDQYYDALCARLDFPVLGDPRRCVLESGWFYDSNFHLNASGAIRFTRLLTEDVKVYLRDASPTAIASPAMPLPASRAFEGDDSCDGCFTYRQEEDGFVICGVTEEGRSATALVLPATHQGRPVTGVDAGVLQRCERLTVLTVQPNIALLHDGMFSGCSALRRVRLTSAFPGDYSVGDGLMEGADFVLLVPAPALDAYRLSYFWQRYEPWLRADE